MSVNDVYRCEVHYNIGSEQTMNVFSLRETTASTDAIPAQAVASAIQNKWETLYGSAVFAPNAYVTLIYVRRFRPTAHVPHVLILGPTEVNGGGTGLIAPSQAALLASLYTGTNTRRGRGRMYIPGVDVDAQDDGQLLPAGLTAAATAVNTLEQPWVPDAPLDGEWELVVWSRADNAGYKVLTAIAHSNLATQRGRRNFPGVAS